ncbi:MAG: DUF177 domain-containing protein [Pseudorhodoplanes sp.]|nr:DUF177 domain-containing protein [Pseudorhodoplanes sp.]
MTTPGSVWSHPISIDDVPERGIHVDLVADEAARAEIAKVADLRDLPRLAASFDITREGTDALRIAGEVSATVGQNCVVTLEPIENEVSEGIDLLFASRAKGSIGDSEGKITLDFNDPDSTEPLREGAIDLGAVATEFLLLGIDPYPRKEGAEFEAPKTPEDPSKHPFAALEALKKAGGRDKK